jgi:hypothetical protein
MRNPVKLRAEQPKSIQASQAKTSHPAHQEWPFTIRHPDGRNVIIVGLERVGYWSFAIVLPAKSGYR